MMPWRKEELFIDIQERVHQSVYVSIPEIDWVSLGQHRITSERFYNPISRELTIRLNALCRTGFFIVPLTWWDHFKYTYRLTWWLKRFVNRHPIMYDLKETIVRDE
jgi:hypothetical protein